MPSVLYYDIIIKRNTSKLSYKYNVNTIFSMLKEQTKLGLTFGQILAIIGLLITLIGTYVSLTSRITALEVNSINTTANYQSIKKELVDGAKENKDDHIMLQKQIKEDNERVLDKIDDLKR